MTRAHYYVVHHQNEWKISLNSQHYGPYATQRDAIQAAVVAAREAHKSGHDAQVLVQGQDNQWRTEWTYGSDPYPPAG